jgi:cell division protein FtsB
MTRKRLADRRQRRRQKALFLGIAIALVGYGVFVGDHRPWHLAMLWIEQGQTEERIDALKRENRELLGERQRLSDDDYALEQLAREKGMVRPGDMVYRIVPVPLARERAVLALERHDPVLRLPLLDPQHGEVPGTMIACEKPVAEQGHREPEEQGLLPSPLAAIGEPLPGHAPPNVVAPA